MSREAFDVLFDNIVTRLETASTAEAGKTFAVKPDNIRALSEGNTDAWVLPRIDQLEFDTETSAVGEEFGITATYAIDCIVQSGKTTQAAGRAAFARLRYLVTQVVNALWVRSDWDLGMSDNIHRAIPEVTWIPPEIQTGEKAIIGATVNLEVGLTWQLTEPAGTDIDRIDVDGGMYETIHEYGED
jgi:hypothetical protein